MHTKYGVVMKHSSSFKCTHAAYEHVGQNIRSDAFLQDTQSHASASACVLDLNDTTLDSSKKQETRSDKMEVNEIVFLCNGVIPV